VGKTRGLGEATKRGAQSLVASGGVLCEEKRRLKSGSPDIHAFTRMPLFTERGFIGTLGAYMSEQYEHPRVYVSCIMWNQKGILLYENVYYVVNSQKVPQTRTRGTH
jgi:hypothetical protein